MEPEGASGEHVGRDDCAMLESANVTQAGTMQMYADEVRDSWSRFYTISPWRRRAVKAFVRSKSVAPFPDSPCLWLRRNVRSRCR